MKSTGLSEQDCINVMRDYINKIEKINKLINSSGWISFVDRNDAQMLLFDLKQCLKEDFRKRETRYGEKQMTIVEKHFLFPAIQHAYTDIRVKTNSIPSGKWVSELYEATCDINFYLLQLIGK